MIGTEFIPTTREEFEKLGWNQADIIIISGDTLSDTYFDGAAVIARVLLDAGYKTAIIAQPDLDSPEDITRLGEPRLFWGVTAGCVDSMVANYTALKKKIRSDDMTPGGENNRRPDRAIIKYTNLIRKYYKNTAPIVIGGVEASLRRISHYDYWDDKIRRSILFDSKADYLIYGMGEKSVLELAEKLDNPHQLENYLKTGNLRICHSERSQESSLSSQRLRSVNNKSLLSDAGPNIKKNENRFFTPLRSVQNDNYDTIQLKGEVLAPLSSWRGAGGEVLNIRGLCYISKETNPDYILLPSYDEVCENKMFFVDMFEIFYRNQDAYSGRGLVQKHGDRYLIQNPPQFPLDSIELDKIHELPFKRDIHPYYKKFGKVKSQDTIQFSIITHRGCYGECNFCAITVHQGKTIQSRSKESILREARKITKMKNFKGYISDLGGPTANMYENECLRKNKDKICKKHCMEPKICPLMAFNHLGQIDLLREIRKIEGIKKVFVASGIRYDLTSEDKFSGEIYLEEVITHHVSGQLKIAPEHTTDHVLKAMGKPESKYLKKFKDDFYEISKKAGLKQFLTYYLIAAHPGCTDKDMHETRNFFKSEMNTLPEQVQIFTPTPSTYSSLMYYTGYNPFTKENIFVEKDLVRKRKQKEIIVGGV